MYFFKQKLVPYLFISPFFIGFSIFFVYPVIAALWLSFHRQIGIGSQARFVGLANYGRLFQDDLFLKSLMNTTYYALGSVLIIVPLALGLALMLSIPNLRFREFFRLFFFTPYITSGVVVGIIFSLVFNDRYGLLNNFVLIPVGIEPIRWLRNPAAVIPAIILLGVWRFTGLNALYFLVGLQNIPPQYKEAARVDGANRFQTFWFVTLPLLTPVLAFVLTLALVGSYQLFAEPMVLLDVSGGPNNSGLTMIMYLYSVGFRQLNLGYAAAIGYVLAFIIVIVTVFQLVLLRVFREE